MKIQFILKESTIADIKNPWVNAGNNDNTDQGGFTFKSEYAINYVIEDGLIIVETSEGTYIYNISDFYRIKIIQD